LADRYRVGDDLTKRNYPEAIRWYRAAAHQGVSAAQKDLGSMYQTALGDPVEAARWYRKAADQGLATAQFNYAMRLLHGDGIQNNHGIETNDAHAVEWLTRAAAQGHIEAIGELGTLFRFGRGVEQNYVTAASLHVKAAAAGDVVSLGNLTSYQPEIEQ